MVSNSQDPEQEQPSADNTSTTPNPQGENQPAVEGSDVTAIGNTVVDAARAFNEDWRNAVIEITQTLDTKRDEALDEIQSETTISIGKIRAFRDAALGAIKKARDAAIEAVKNAKPATGGSDMNPVGYEDTNDALTSGKPAPSNAGRGGGFEPTLG